MSKLRDAAQQALEALEDHAKQYPHMQKGYTVDAIAALRTALAEQPAPMSQPNRLIAYSATSKLRELGYEWVDDAWKQSAEQEPVALLHDDGYWTAAKTDAGRRLSERLLFAGSPSIAVYTAPQPRKQPLTREEIFEIAEPFGEFQYGDAQGHKRIDFANAIIAAYERKNGVQT